MRAEEELSRAALVYDSPPRGLWFRVILMVLTEMNGRAMDVQWTPGRSQSPNPARRTEPLREDGEQKRSTIIPAVSAQERMLINKGSPPASPRGRYRRPRARMTEVS